MSGGIAVVKFGGSVLESHRGYRAVAGDIRRLLGQFESVVAVVSAQRGATRRLLEAAGLLADEPSPLELAGLLATGEDASAWGLGIALARHGVGATVIPSAALDLVASGDRLDATPSGVDLGRLHAALAHERVAVVPGFVARHVDGGPAVLGRGGSDLTALYLAARLGARSCRLVKDVDGLYADDPNRAGGAVVTPVRYARAAWADVARLGGGLVQRKALEFAAASGLTFHVGCLGGEGTEIGPSEHAPLEVSS